MAVTARAVLVIRESSLDLIVPDEAEYVIEHAGRDYPRRHGDRFLVWGKTAGGYYLQVVFVYKPERDTVRVIHARPLDGNEKHSYRRNER